MTGFQREYVTKKFKLQIQSIKSQMDSFSIYKEKNKELEKKQNLIWQEMGKPKLNYNINKQKEPETRINEIFIYKFYHNQLKWWYTNKPINRICLLCKIEKETTKHVFWECKIAQNIWIKWAKVINMKSIQHFWGKNELNKPLIWGNIKIGGNYFFKQAQENIISNEQILKLQKRIYHMGINEILYLYGKQEIK